MKIGFGTKYQVSKERALTGDSVEVVVDPEMEGRTSTSAPLTDLGNGPQFSLLSGAGTASRKNIEKITGRLNLLQMIAAANLGMLRVIDRPLNEDEINELIELAKKPDRELPE